MQRCSQLAVGCALAIAISGCGGGGSLDCDGEDKAAQQYNGQWINVASSSGDQILTLKDGWNVEGGRPQSGWWAAAEAAISTGFEVIGADAGIPVSGDVAASFVQHIADYFDPQVDGKQGQRTYTAKLGPGTVWQWQIQNGEDCKGTKLKTQDTMLTPLRDSSFPPCCLPTMFAGDEAHGLCTPGTTNLCEGHSTPAPRDGMCLKKSPNNGCGGCTTEDDCGSTGSDCDGSSCCQAAADKSCGSTASTTTSTTATPAPNATSWCNKVSPANACNPCSNEADCGNTADGQFFCWASKDSRCDSFAASGWCKHDSPANACQACTVEADCGNTVASAAYCWAEKDPACKSVASVDMVSGWCKHDSPSNACQACTVEADCGNTGGSAAYCWAQKDPACGAMPVVINSTVEIHTVSGWCKLGSPAHACQSCSVEADCGNTDAGKVYCWAQKDAGCGLVLSV